MSRAIIEELREALPTDFKAKGNIFVFVDECHRTQSGDLHEAMKAILPGAMFIGFTGTPLLKADKQTSIEIFGPYIHTYKFDEAVEDGVVLDLRYEARDIDQNLTSPEKIDQWFEAKTKGLTDLAKAQLKKRWGTMQKVLSSQSRLEKIVDDILLDMETKRPPAERARQRHAGRRPASTRPASSTSCSARPTSRASARSSPPTSRRPTTSKGGQRRRADRAASAVRDLPQDAGRLVQRAGDGRDKVEQFEKEVKKKFIDEPGQMRLLIVVDKLLTGFDAPSATYLYIDKQMRDHGLFQAICRVNRLDGDDKEYGYIVDYKDLFKTLETSINDYTAGRSTATTRRTSPAFWPTGSRRRRERLDEALEAVRALCEPVEAPRDTRAYLRFFCARDTADKAAAERERAEAADALQARGVARARLCRSWPTRWTRPATPTPRSARSRPRSTTTRKSATR